jgi:hypothetical protein
VWETNETREVNMTGHTVAASGKLSGNGAVADDHTRDCGGMVRADKNTSRQQ